MPGPTRARHAYSNGFSSYAPPTVGGMRLAAAGSTDQRIQRPKRGWCSGSRIEPFPSDPGAAYDRHRADLAVGSPSHRASPPGPRLHRSRIRCGRHERERQSARLVCARAARSARGLGESSIRSANGAVVPSRGKSSYDDHAAVMVRDDSPLRELRAPAYFTTGGSGLAVSD